LNFKASFLKIEIGIMKRILWTVFGIVIGAAFTYMLIKSDEEESNDLPLIVMKKAKGSLNDEVFAGIQSEDDEDWL
jgi:hypothetical protein